jgi:putative GTP pyrophosphokinase
VCLFISDISRTNDIVKKHFYIISEDNKIDQTESSFGYLSVHFIVKLKDNCSGPRYDPIIGLTFEIQVKTLAMDAWANISHYLDYKSELDIPKELKRDFYALSGLFYVADKHFEMFFKSRERNTRRLEELEITPDQEINLDSLTVYLNKRLPDRDRSSPDGVSKMVS